MEAHEFLLKHSQELSEKYPGKYVAIVGDKLVAIGHSEPEVFEKAKEKYPDKEVSIVYLPTDEEMVTNIIGRLDIFDRFKICFDESKKIMEFYPNKLE